MPFDRYGFHWHKNAPVRSTSTSPASYGEALR